MASRSGRGFGAPHPWRGWFGGRARKTLSVAHPKLGCVALTHQLGIGNVAGLGDHLGKLMGHTANDLITVGVTVLP